MSLRYYSRVRAAASHCAPAKWLAAEAIPVECNPGAASDFGGGGRHVCGMVDRESSQIIISDSAGRQVEAEFELGGLPSIAFLLSPRPRDDFVSSK